MNDWPSSWGTDEAMKAKEPRLSFLIPRFLNTGGRVLFLWNHGVLDGADRVMIYEGEIDALTAIEAGQKGTRDIAGRFIRPELPAPRQLILDQGKDLNEFYHLMQSKKC